MAFKKPLKIYPNPANQGETIYISEEYGSILITDLYGRKMKGLQNLPIGIYLIIIDGEYKTKLIIK